MRPLRYIVPAVLSIVLTACAGGPGPDLERLPKEQRLSIRHLNKGTEFYHKGCYPQAVQSFQQAHERFSAADNLEGTADSLNSLANAYYRLNDYKSAVLVYDEAIELFGIVGDRAGQIRALTGKSAALAFSGDLKAAGSSLDRADALAADDDTLAGLRLKTRAILEFKSGDADGAKDQLSKAMSAIPKGETGLYAGAQYTMGRIMLSTGETAEALTYLDRALEADRQAAAYDNIGLDLEALGDAHMQLEQYEPAVSHYKRSLKIFALLGSTEKVKQILPKLEQSASKAQTDIEAALNWTSQWMAGRKESNICR